MPRIVDGREDEIHEDPSNIDTSRPRSPWLCKLMKLDLDRAVWRSIGRGPSDLLRLDGANQDVLDLFGFDLATSDDASRIGMSNILEPISNRLTSGH